MPTYQFQADDGDVIERVYPVSKAPALGKVVRERGKQYRRVISVPHAPSEFKPYTSYCLPKGTPGFKHDRKGRPVVESRQQEQSYAKRMGYEFATTKDDD